MKSGPTLLSHRYERLMEPPCTLAVGASWSTAPMLLPIAAASVIFSRRLQALESSIEGDERLGAEAALPDAPSCSAAGPKDRALSNFQAWTGGQRGIRTLE